MIIYWYCLILLLLSLIIVMSIIWNIMTMMYPPNLHSRYLERRRYSKGRVGTAASEGSGTMREKHEHLRILECFISVARCRNSTHTKTYYYSCIKARIRQLVWASTAVAFTIFRCLNGGNGCEVPRSLSQPDLEGPAPGLQLVCSLCPKLVVF